MSDLFTKAARLKTTTKLWVIAIALTIMVNIPFVDNHFRPKPIGTTLYSPPEMSPTVADNRIEEQPRERTEPLSLAGEFIGIVHNQTTQLSAEFEIKVQNSGGKLSGSMLVTPPLSGSGPLEGSTSGSNVIFTVKSSIGTLTFLGTRSNQQITGTYTVKHSAGPKESGTFVLLSSSAATPIAPPVAVPAASPALQPLKTPSTISAVTDARPSPPTTVKHSDPNNLSYCLNGYTSCDHNLLTPEESAQVAAGDKRRNFSYCLNGYTSCDHDLLTPEESAQVAATDKRRNFLYCQNGYASCDRNLLTSEESAQVAASNKIRNFLYCQNGYASCDRNLLTPEELVEVQARERQRHH